MSEGRVLVASNRGPVTFVDEDGELVPKRGAGGLVSALTGAVQEAAGLWVASAMSEGDRARLRTSADGRIDVADGEANYRVRLLAFDREAYDRAYNGISNRVLWFLHHYLWDLARAPAFGTETRQAWDAYRTINHAFASALAEESGSRSCSVLVQDYHLALVPAKLRKLAPTARIAHFHHSPFTAPDYLGLLPSDILTELMDGLLGADVLGFQTRRWAENFLECCEFLAGAGVDRTRNEVTWRDRTVRVRVYPISIDADGLREDSASPEVERRREELERLRGDRALVLRVDRAELSKNVLRGFLAFGELLRHRPELRGRVVFLALLNPSRLGLAEYSEYLDECLEAGARINAELGEPGWTPVEIRVDDDFNEVLAAYRLYDVLVVNPLFDGMNLVAKEGPVLNERDGVLLLSRNAGAFAELGASSVPLDPLDVSGTADAMHRALTMDAAERSERAARLRDAASSQTPADWAAHQLEDLSSI